MIFKVVLAAGLLFGTGVLTGLGVGRLAQTERERPSTRETPVPAPAVPTERAIRSNRTNTWRLPVLRPPGAGRLEQFKRALGDLDLESTQRERIEKHFRESQERLKSLLKPVQPEALRELRTLRQQILAELSPEQRAQFDRQNAERSNRPHVPERRD